MTLKQDLAKKKAAEQKAAAAQKATKDKQRKLDEARAAIKKANANIAAIRAEIAQLQADNSRLEKQGSSALKRGNSSEARKIQKQIDGNNKKIAERQHGKGKNPTPYFWGLDQYNAQVSAANKTLKTSGVSPPIDSRADEQFVQSQKARAKSLPASAAPAPGAGPPASPAAGGSIAGQALGSMSRNTVRALQQELQSQGFNPGPIDGIMGPRTRAAVAARDAQGGGGGGSAGSSAADAPSQYTGPSAEADAIVRQKYGYMAWALDIPELRGILDQAGVEGWDEATLKGALDATNWWQTHGVSAREFIRTQHEDKATADRQIAAATESIRQQAGSFGVPINEARLKQMAVDSLMQGWSNQELRHAIANEYHYDPSINATNPNATVQQLQEQAAQYLIPLSTNAIQQWTQQIITGTQTAEGFGAYLVQQAKNLYPYMADALTKGTTVRQYVDPYVQLAANELEITPDQVDFSQPKWSRALNQIDAKTGQRVPMALPDWQATLRSDPMYGFDNTQKARQASAQFQQTIMERMGFAA